MTFGDVDLGDKLTIKRGGEYKHLIVTSWEMLLPYSHAGWYITRVESPEYRQTYPRFGSNE